MLDPPRQPVGLCNPALAAQEAVDLVQAGAGQHVFVGDVPADPLSHVAEKGDLLLGLSRETAVSPFRGHRVMALAVPVEHGLAETRAGGDDGDVAAAVRGGPGVQDV